MFEEDITMNSTILFPFLSTNIGNENQNKNDWVFDTNFSSEEFECEYKKNFKNKANQEKPNIDTANNTKEYSIINQANQLLTSLKNSVIKSDEQYKEFSECLFDLISINDYSNNKKSNKQLLILQDKVISVMVQYISTQVNRK